MKYNNKGDLLYFYQSSDKIPKHHIEFTDNVWYDTKIYKTLDKTSLYLKIQFELNDFSELDDFINVINNIIKNINDIEYTKKFNKKLKKLLKG